MPDPEQPPILLVERVTQRFPGVTALDSVDFQLRPGEVMALLGENGAGKSTLLKVLTGLHQPDEGEIRLADTSGQYRVIHPKSPAEAITLGISPVYQEVNLVPNLTVAENICLAREPQGPFGIRWKKLRERAQTALDRIALRVDPSMRLGACSIAVQQMVAIARALDVSARILILDEPTSSLDPDEVAQLFALMRRLRDEGVAIVFVTHFLDQVYEIADRITVLRNGKLIGVWNTPELPRLDLVSHMLGRDASGLEASAKTIQSRAAHEALVTTHGLTRKGAVTDVSLTVGGGEVLGLAGLLGSGRTETLRLIFGLDRPDSGHLNLRGEPVSHFGPMKAIKAGLGFCPEDRKSEAIFPGLSVRENMVVASQAKLGVLRRIALSRQRQIAGEMIDRMSLRPADPERPVQLLSGGNQQKAVFARWLAAEPVLLLLDEPTRGIDVGAKFEIMSLIDRLSTEGMGFVFVSSELAEVVRSCSRVYVLRDGRIVQELTGDEISEHAIVEAIAGGAGA